MKPRIQQLHQSGAQDGDAIVWDNGLGYWVPGPPVVATPCRATLVAASAATGVDLGVEPVTSTELVFVNGALLTWGVDYTISGTQILLDTALTPGDRISIAYQSAGSCGTATMLEPFAPDAVAGMDLWLAADDLALSDGDPVGTWADLSGAGNDATQGSSGQKPTFKTGIINGLPVVRFDGSDDFLASNASMSLTTRTLIAVIKLAGSGYRTIVGASSTNALQWRIDSGTGVQTLNRQYTAAIGSSSTDVGTSAFRILAATFTDNASHAFYLDGAADGSGSHSGTITSGRTATIGTNPTAGEWLNGDLAELIAYDSVLGSGDLGAVTAYLQAKYAL